MDEGTSLQTTEVMYCRIIRILETFLRNQQVFIELGE